MTVRPPRLTTIYHREYSLIISPDSAHVPVLGNERVICMSHIDLQKRH